VPLLLVLVCATSSETQVPNFSPKRVLKKSHLAFEKKAFRSKGEEEEPPQINEPKENGQRTLVVFRRFSRRRALSAAAAVFFLGRRRSQAKRVFFATEEELFDDSQSVWEHGFVVQRSVSSRTTRK